MKKFKKRIKPNKSSANEEETPEVRDYKRDMAVQQALYDEVEPLVRIILYAVVHAGVFYVLTTLLVVPMLRGIGGGMLLGVADLLEYWVWPVILLMTAVNFVRFVWGRL